MEQHKKKLTQYAIRLEEKQKIRFNYGLSEKQLMNYIKQAKKNQRSNRYYPFTTFRNAIR